MADYKTILIVLVLTLISGFGDSKGFTHASKVWKNDKLVPSELLYSALGFAVGFVAFWIVIRYMQKINIVTPEIQTILWFGVTIIGVSLLSGAFFKWQLLEQTIAVLIVIGIGWLLFNTGG